MQFLRVRLWERSLVHDTTRHRQLLGLSIRDFQKLPKKVGNENYSKWLMRNVCKMSHRDRLICFAGFVGMTLLAVLFLLLLPNCFVTVRLPTLLAAVLKLFLPLTTSAVSGAANSNMSAPTRFAAGTVYLRKKGYAVLPITCASAPNPRPCCRLMPL